MSNKKKKTKVEPQCVCCTPNCIYFPQEVSPEDIISQKRENGVTYRQVRRFCLYDGSQIKSWSHQCGRGASKPIMPK